MDIRFLLYLCALAFQPQVHACGGEYTFTRGVISSPSYPLRYPPDQDCVYIIKAPTTYRITLKFVTFQLEVGDDGCIYDFLQVRDGNSMDSPLVGSYCDTDIPKRLKSASNNMWIKFHSDSTRSAAGFKAIYTARATYTLDRVNPNKFLLVSKTDPNAIYRIYLDTNNNFTIPFDEMQDPVAIDFDPPSGRIYWTDMAGKTIRSSNIYGSDVKLILALGHAARLHGLAIDSLSRLIYYTDSGNRRISLITMYGEMDHYSIITSHLDMPGDIELDKHNGVMYWTDVGVTPKIERANYDGTDRQVLLSGYKYLDTPNALALDTVGQRLYWADAGTELIGSTDLDGRNTRIIIQKSGSHFFGMDIYRNELFVTDRRDSSDSPLVSTTCIHRISIDGKRQAILATLYGRVNDVRVYSKETEDKGPNGCGHNNGGCSEICIPAPRNSSKCLFETIKTKTEL